MSRLTDLIAQAKAKDPQMGADLEREFKALSSRRSFGLNFEKHRPETVELPNRQVRKGDKVRVLPSRGETQKGDKRLWQIKAIKKHSQEWVATLVELYASEPDSCEVLVDDLVVVAEFRDKIYPGLVSTGKVERGGDKPYHAVINGENFHALKALTYTHRGRVDAIYIDPPYNTGARDWKYNNDYVEGEDLYRHSKWLAFIERRLKIAKDLLNPQEAILTVSIDEKEYLRLGLLLEQTFPEARIQMISSVINPAGVTRPGAFARTDEYIFFVFFGSAKAKPVPLSDEWRVNPKDTRTTRILWSMLMRTGTNAQRIDRPKLFYPIFVSTDGKKIVDVGKPPKLGVDRNSIDVPNGCKIIWPIRSNETEGNWQVSPDKLTELYEKGFVRLGKFNGRSMSLSYLKSGEQKKVLDGTYIVTGKKDDGSIIAENSGTQNLIIPTTAWKISSHDASRHGSNLLKTLLPDRKFPFPKSLYAVEDCLKFFLHDKKDAVVLDFFAGSGTTCHAVMRLNKQDNGSRRAIIITNNEVAADEHLELKKGRLRPGDEAWEILGICNYITKPRIKSAILGLTPDGTPIVGDYRFSDEFPISDGFEENAEFFTLTYESPLAINHNLAFERIAPLLWLRAGSVGYRINQIPENGWDVAESYGVLVDLDKSADFVRAVKQAANNKIAYIVTNDDRRFQAVARSLPDGVEPVRLYESYLNNFQFANGE